MNGSYFFCPRYFSSDSGKKPLPADYRTRIQTRPKWGHKERELDIEGGDGEVDFIINYDIKYRMGRDAAEGNEKEVG